jgi:hypothetical protein
MVSSGSAPLFFLLLAGAGGNITLIARNLPERVLRYLEAGGHRDAFDMGKFAPEKLTRLHIAAGIGDGRKAKGNPLKYRRLPRCAPINLLFLAKYRVGVLDPLHKQIIRAKDRC